jgi:hypothetical protein
MKTTLALILLGFSINSVYAQNNFTLNECIEDAASFLNERIPDRTTISVFNFSSESRKLSEYIVDELTIALINIGLDVYDRNNLDEVNREIYYGFSGAVDDNTAQAYGHDIGVQTVVLGSITESSNNTYRLRIQAIVVETKRVQAGRTFNVKQDELLMSLLDIKIQKEYRFTSEEKTMAGFENMLFGLGSFKMGDPLGGGISLVGGVVSLGLFIPGIIIYIPAHNYEYSKRASAEEDIDGQERTGRTMLITGGIGLGLTLIWDFVRPFLYDKPTEVRRTTEIIDNIDIGIISNNTNLTMIIKYSF